MVIFISALSAIVVFAPWPVALPQACRDGVLTRNILVRLAEAGASVLLRGIHAVVVRELDAPQRGVADAFRTFLPLRPIGLLVRNVA